MIIGSERRLISAASVLETAMVLESKRGEDAGREFDLFVLRTNLEVVPVDAEQVEIARLAWRRFGKSRNPAALNFGDCFAYALAKSSGEPLLAKATSAAFLDDLRGGGIFSLTASKS